MILNWENLGENWFEGIIGRFGREHEYSKVMPEYDDCKKYLEIIGNLVYHVDSTYPDQNLLFFRVREMPKQLSILHFLIVASLYPQSIRELRYILESVIQAYYIDMEHPDAGIMCKLEVLKEIEMMVGGRLIEATNLGEKKKIHKLYKDLSRYTHSSHEKLEPAIERELTLNIFFGYNDRMFKEATALTKRTVDTILFIILNFQNHLIPIVNDNEELKDSLSNFKLTNQLISSL